MARPRSGTKKDLTDKGYFFREMNRRFMALTYADVRLRTNYSKVMLSEVDTTSNFTRNIQLRMPIVSAAMTDVTEHKLAIAMAKAGGIGIIHRRFTPIEQAFEVMLVKHYLNGMIKNPQRVFFQDKINEVEKMCQDRAYHFHTFPVLNADDQLVGLVTSTDFMLWKDHPEKTIQEIMTPNPVTAKEGTTITEALDIMRQKKKKVLPLVDSDQKVVAMYVLGDVKRVLAQAPSGFSLDKEGRLRVGAAIGTGPGEIERARELVNRHVDVLVIDTAHGDSEPVYTILKELVKLFGDKVDIMVGNVSEADSALRLAQAGAHGVKVGQGPGSICTTRIVAGVGCPQVTAVYNCVQAVRGMDVPICADGGIENSGDIPIALGVGASSVMIGSLFAGTDESPGEIKTLDGVAYKVYRGMGSLGAMENSAASRERYGQVESAKDRLVPEGIEGIVPIRGALANTLHQLHEGLRKGMGYVGASNIADFQRNADFWLIPPAGQAESHVHGIVRQTQSAPNYTSRS